MSIVAIDVGYRNFAWIKIDKSSWIKPLIWRHEDWWAHQRGKPSRLDILQMTNRWIKTNHAYLKHATRIILERQLKIPFAVMNACIFSHYPEQVEFVSPNTVGAFWSLPSRRKLKKARGIAVVREHGLRFPDARKADDLADAWLMAMRHAVITNLVPRQDLQRAKDAHSLQTHTSSPALLSAIANDISSETAP